MLFDSASGLVFDFVVLGFGVVVGFTVVAFASEVRLVLDTSALGSCVTDEPGLVDERVTRFLLADSNVDSEALRRLGGMVQVRPRMSLVST